MKLGGFEGLFYSSPAQHTNDDVKTNSDDAETSNLKSE
jgi:hypothetical protein